MAAVQSRLASISVGDVELSYVEQGEGEPVLFVHGSNSDYRIWGEHGEYFAPRYRMIALSQRYFGTGPWPDNGENFRVQVHADDLAEFIRGLNVAPVTIVGWSFGGGVCLTMGVQNPDLVKRMFLFEPALATFVSSPEDAKAALEDRAAMSAGAASLAEVGDLAGAVRSFTDGVNEQAGAFDGFSPSVRAMMTENARMLPLLLAGPPPPAVTADDLRGLALPITIALGEHSRAFYRIAAEAAQALLPSAELKVVAGARHLWPIQDPPAFSRQVLDFLER